MTWNTDQLFSSKSNEWATPQPLFDHVNAELGPFVLDAAASDDNAKCDLYLTDALNVSWADTLWQNGYDPGRSAVWLNPPYGRSIALWLEKAVWESKAIQTIVILTMVRSDTMWWRNYAMRAAEIRMIAGRVRFAGAKSSAPAPSCLLVFDERRRVPKVEIVEVPRSE